MTTILYHEWIRGWDRKLRSQDCHVLLLQDNMSAHKPPEDITNITVVDFAPNLMAHVQPADAGIIKCFKGHYRSHFISRAIDHYDQDITPANIYQINILEAIRLAEVAWNEVTPTTIHNCWKKTHILPKSLLQSHPLSSPSIPTSQPLNPDSTEVDESADLLDAATRDILSGLDELEKRGVLQSCNKMDINSLLNPEGEDLMMDDSTDIDIFNTVMQKEEDVSATVDESDVVTPKPTRREALAAASPSISTSRT